MVMTEKQFYGSKKHFDTEMSYEEYLEVEEVRKNRLKKKIASKNLFKTPTMAELMRM